MEQILSWQNYFSKTILPRIEDPCLSYTLTANAPPSTANREEPFVFAAKHIFPKSAIFFSARWQELPYNYGGETYSMEKAESV
jgi:hypothetical protein